MKDIVTPQAERPISILSRIPRKAWLWLSLLYVGVFLLALKFPMRDKQAATDFYNLYPMPAFVFGIACCVGAARRETNSRARRWGWLLLGLSCLADLTGDLIWSWYETFRRAEVPFPGLSDFAYLMMYPFLLAGVLLLGDIGRMAGRMRLFLDSAIAAGSAGILSWYFLMQPLWKDSEDSLLGKLVGIAYPLSDITALFGAMVLLYSASTQPGLRRSLLLVAAGTVVWAIGDSFYTYETLLGVYHTGSWYDWAWPTGAILVGHAALMPRGNVLKLSTTSLRDSLNVSSPMRLLLPYLVGLLSLWIVAVDDHTHDGVISTSVILAGVWLVSLVIARQIFTLFDNRSLTIEVCELNENLEKTVAQRTEQLRGLHELTKAINSTLHENRVLDDAMKYTQRALQADAVVLWLPEENAGDEIPDHSSYAEIEPSEYSLARHRGLDGHSEVAAMLKTLATCNCTETVAILQQENGIAANPNTDDRQPSCIRAPLMWQQEELGAIGVLRWSGGFGKTEAELIESIGVEVGTALGNASLRRGR